MKRRSVLALPFAAVVAHTEAHAEESAPLPAVFELRRFQLRSGKQVERTTDYLRRGWLPAAQRAGAGPIGLFNALIAPESPFVLAITSFPSLGAIADLGRKLATDKEFQTAFEEYNSGEPGYIRLESAVLGAFPSMPALAVPPTEANRPARIFELRTYESPNEATLARKVKMFGDGEIEAFRRSGMRPVFFGSALIGRDMPSLTYMLAYDDWDAREKAWSAFGKDPGWQKLRATPGLSDAEIVSNISNQLLRPLAFSPIR
jgi:hypothetical protein